MSDDCEFKCHCLQMPLLSGWVEWNTFPPLSITVRLSNCGCHVSGREQIFFECVTSPCGSMNSILNTF